MRVQKKLGIFLYIISDFLAAAFAWAGLYIFRKISIEGNALNTEFLTSDPNFFLGITIIPIAWLSFYFILGSYTDIHRKSRLAELNKTFFATLVGVVIIFFTLLLDDIVSSYKNYYQTFGMLFLLQFLFTISGRFILLNSAKSRLRKGIVSYRTLIIGGNKNATQLYKEIKSMDTAMGYE
ncbi:MAG: sugar transferase, partial [Chitinophagales bacterium]|nr:sugar transferase [Chitinophagales bacterium]